MVHDSRQLPLAWKEEDREHRQHDQPEPRAVALGFPEPEQVGQVGIGAGTAEQIAEPTEAHVRDVEADGEERDQLDQRLERNGRDHALVPLGGVQVPGTEDDREGGEQQRDVERRVGQDRRVGRDRPGQLGLGAQDRERVGDGLELKRDVRNDPDHGDDGDESAEQSALAVSRGDEVGEGGDPVLLANPDDLASRATTRPP